MTDPQPKFDNSEQIARRIDQMGRLNKSVEAARQRTGMSDLSAVHSDGILICQYAPTTRTNTYQKRVRRIFAHFDYNELEEAIEFVDQT